MKRFLLSIMILVAVAAASFIGGRRHARREFLGIKPDTLVVHDTLRYPQPIAVSEKPIGIISFRFFNLPDSLSGSVEVAGDSITMHTTQKHYREKDFEAWVSGFQPNLDSIRVYRETQYIPVYYRESEKKKRFNVSLSAGYGVTPYGSAPFVGATVGFTLFSF